ncbi:OmpA family protein [Sphaerisporangium aureirubrum]|uniref:OmpA family protein n=1 Tax=Sphaerisporangium aureirubrum TaxID=1544736 RepID=A0ABW1NJZ2_9ACTN
MFRSASAPALVLVLLTTGATPSPPPVPAATGAVLDLTAPVLDLTAPVLDIDLRIANLDESFTDSKQGDQRKLIVAADVLFAFDKASPTGKARSRLEQAAATLRAEARGQQVRVDGYTDAKGSNAYNLDLSLRRARAVTRVLEELLAGTGITFAPRGHGAADPVAPNTKADGADDPKGRAKNRRVEIAFTL